jgi:hypothetical protein
LVEAAEEIKGNGGSVSEAKKMATSTAMKDPKPSRILWQERSTQQGRAIEPLLLGKAAGRTQSEVEVGVPPSALKL